MSASENCWGNFDEGSRSTRSGERCPSLNGFDIAVIIPCYNEARTIGHVVQDFHRHLPGATVYVFDNGSNDSTAAVAQAAGAIVIWEGRRGKGNVVRRMFAEVLADAYVMIDGDGTYDVAAAPEMIQLLFAERTRHGGRNSPRIPRAGAVSQRASIWEPLADSYRAPDIRARFRRRVVRLPSIFAALRQIIPSKFHWV